MTYTPHLQIKPKYDISLGITGMTDARIIEEVTYLLRREGVPQHEIEEFRTQTHTYSPDDYYVFLRTILSWVGVIEMSSEDVACLEWGDSEYNEQLINEQIEAVGETE